jgi:inner membrane protein
MDSLSQIALGSAVGIAVMGRHSSVARAAAWGAIAGTLPDLDVLVDHGNPIHNMVLHRSDTHALLWLTLFSLPLAALVCQLHKEWPLFRRWWLALWLVLITHPLLDWFTVYGTQLGRPFSSYPFAVGSIFIVDPLFTLPLLVGIGWTLYRKRAGWRSGNSLGLALGSTYLLWGVVAQQYVQNISENSLSKQGITVDRMLVTPTPLNSLVWRIVVISGDRYLEGYYSLFDKQPPIRFAAFGRNTELEQRIPNNDGLMRISAFSKGFYALEQVKDQIVIKDLRMGQEPNYTFSFVLAKQHSPAVSLAIPERVAFRPDVACGSQWLRKRVFDATLPTLSEHCRPQ